MTTEIFDSEEQEILQNFESGAFVSTLTPERKKQLAQIAEQTFKTDSCIEITLSTRDLYNIQIRREML